MVETPDSLRSYGHISTNFNASSALRREIVATRTGSF